MHQRAHTRKHSHTHTLFSIALHVHTIHTSSIASMCVSIFRLTSAFPSLGHLTTHCAGKLTNSDSLFRTTNIKSHKKIPPKKTTITQLIASCCIAGFLLCTISHTFWSQAGPERGKWPHIAHICLGSTGITATICLTHVHGDVQLIKEVSDRL